MSIPEKTDITATTTTTTTIKLPSLTSFTPTIKVYATAILTCMVLVSASGFVHELRLFIESILGKM